MSCNCISTVDVLLKPRNTRLGATLWFTTPAIATVTIVTEQIEKGRGKAKACAMLPTFCPFCGSPYREQAQDAAEVATVGAE